MSSIISQQTTPGEELRRIEMTLRPESSFPVPLSDGYPVYSALLSVLDDADETVAARVHDSPLGSIHSSGLLGLFGGSDRKYHKSVRAREDYKLTLGIVDPEDAGIFEALAKSLVIDGSPLSLTDGMFHVNAFESESVHHADLLDRAGEADNPTVSIRFRTPTCILEGEEITTMFPHRVAVFRSIANKWNQTAPSELEIGLAREDIEDNVIEKPDARSYQSKSIVVGRGEEGRPLHRQGFTCDCAYAFKDASESVENAITVLALFAEYSGVGSAVSRGCGNVEVSIDT